MESDTYDGSISISFLSRLFHEWCNFFQLFGMVVWEEGCALESRSVVRFPSYVSWQQWKLISLWYLSSLKKNDSHFIPTTQWNVFTFAVLWNHFQPMVAVNEWRKFCRPTLELQIIKYVGLIYKHDTDRYHCEVITLTCRSTVYVKYK